MTDLTNRPLAPELVAVAERMGFIPRWGLAGTHYVGTEGEARDAVDFSFQLLDFRTPIEEGKMFLPLKMQVPVLELFDHRRRDVATIGLIGEQAALLYHSEGQEYYNVLPPRGEFMPHETIVLLWQDYSYRRRERIALARAFGLPEPARNAA